MSWEAWNEAATTSVGLFWSAFWAFGLGYVVSSMIQVFVTRERMRRSLGDTGPRSVALATFFGFVSSSCSFAALSTTRSLFAKGAGLVPSLAFLLASTNLVVELGVVISVFLSWQFVVGEYVGGALLILVTWALVRATRPKALVEEARERARAASEAEADGDPPDWRRLIRSREGWRRVANRYAMEWSMVWKDVTIGFTVAGLIATLVPPTFFRTLFVGSESGDPSFPAVVLQTLVGPAAAFLTFIGSMGNVPLAAVLYGSGVSYAGILAFLFSDLVVFPVLRIQASYYGWRMALYVAGLFLVALSTSSVALHYAFGAFGLLPDPARAESVTERDFFTLDASAWLGFATLAGTAVVAFGKLRRDGWSLELGETVGAKVLTLLAWASLAWLAAGMALPALGVVG